MTTSMFVAELSLSPDALTSGRPFEAFTVGTFTDMRGRTISFTPDDLKRIYDNTRAYLERTRDSLGQIVGLPIDSVNHDHGDAAGWIVGVELVGDILRLIPKWTELGVTKLSKGIQRLFSASIDVENLRIVGGTLTNWPAVKGLKPVELSGHPGLFQLSILSDEPLMEYVSRVTRAFDEFCKANSVDMCWVKDVYQDYVLCSCNGELCRVNYTEQASDAQEAGEGESGSGKRHFVFQPRQEWQTVRLVPVDMKAPPEPAVSPIPHTEADDMGITLDELKATLADFGTQIKTDLTTDFDKKLAAFATPPAAPAAPANPETTAKPSEATAPAATSNASQGSAALEALVDMRQVQTTVEAEFQKALESQLGQTIEGLKTRSQAIIGQRIAELQEEQRLADFCRRATDGALANGRALPIKYERLEGFLKGLPMSARREAEAMFADILTSGVVDFKAQGVGQWKKELKHLPDVIANDLRSGKLNIADLRGPVMRPLLGEFGVTDLSEYDLTEFVAAK